MLLGKIFGKVTTTEFKFLVEQETKKFEYVQVYHPVYEYVLCQVMEVEKQEDMTTALCQIIGYKDKEGRIKKLKIPFEPGSEVFVAEDPFIAKVIKLEDSDAGAYIGKLDGKDIKINLDLKKLLTKHIAILAKSGSGKSYTVGVLLEEIIAKKVPLLIIDPHGEYSSMRQPNTNPEEIKAAALFDVAPKGFSVNEYGDTTLNPLVRPLTLTNSFSPKELIEMLPVKLSSSQLGIIYGATQQMKHECDFDSVLYQLQEEESNLKWNLISIIEQLRDDGLFSPAPTPLHELVRPGACSIINFRGISPEMQDIIVYKLTKDLFDLRKKNKLPPFFLVVEEAHNYCPERSFGEKKSSKMLRTIASEGRKFGLGLCVVSQRPARVDKSVISQCSTQIIMKVTNPNDIKAISSSVEGITSSTEKEMQELSVGTALVTGVTDVPLIVKIRPRMSMHGGHAIDILGQNNSSVQQILKETTTLSENKEKGVTEQATREREERYFREEKEKKEKEIIAKQDVQQQNGDAMPQSIFQSSPPQTSSSKTIAPQVSQEQTGNPQMKSQDKDIIEQLDEFNEQDVIALIKPTSTSKDIALMSEKPVKNVYNVLLPIFIITCQDGEEKFTLLINRVNAEVIVDKETAESKKLPSFETLSKKELRILQTAFKLKKFTSIDIVHEMGVNLDIGPELEELVKKKYITRRDDVNFALSDKFIFNKLSNYKVFDRVQYESLTYSHKHEPRVDIDSVIKKLERFTSVIDHAEAFLLTYGIEYEQ